MAKKISKNDLLFHSVHGLCRVAEVTRTSSSSEVSCALLPMLRSRSKARFVVPRDLLESSGFNRPVSVEEASEIFEYFKTGKKRESAQGPAWEAALVLRAEAYSKEPMRDKRRAQKLNQSAKSLSYELAIVLQCAVREIAERIQKNLKAANPLVLAALSNADAV